MLEDQVAYFLQRYLGNYVRGLSREALKISVWQGNVELTNMQLKPEALNALKLPVKVKAGFLGSVKIKVPWSRLGQDPVLVSLDQIFLLAEPATHVEGCSEDAVQEAKRSRVREMEARLLEKVQQMDSEMNKSWLGSFIDTIIGNLKLSISNIHIRYEDLESNPGRPFAAGLTLEKLSAITVDDNGREIFATGGALERIQKSVELEQLSVYLDSDISPWYIGKLWEELLPSEWGQIFKFGTKDGKPAANILNEHSYILQPVTGNAKYSKLRSSSSIANHPLQKAAVNLDDVTLCLSKDGYGNILKLADNFSAFNQRLKYAHYRPRGSVKSNPRSWWKYAYKAISDQMKKESCKLSWEQVLRYASLRKRYISLYASLLKSDPSRTVIDDNKDITEIDRELDIDLILQWRMLAHKFLDQSLESEVNLRKQKEKKSWWSVGWGNQSYKDENEPLQFSEEDWERLNKIIGYKDNDNEITIITDDKGDVLHTSLDIHMRHNASKLVAGLHDCLAELSCESLDCSIRLYSEAKVFDVKLGSYKLSSPSGLLAESATARDSLVGIFCYKPFDAKVDWSLVAKASPCYMTYLKDSVDQIVSFFGSQPAVSQTVALEAAAAVQMTIDGVKRTAQEQVNKALKDHARFLLDLDIAAPKISIPTDFRPDHVHTTKLMLDLGNLVIRTQDEGSNEEMNLYLQFDLVLSDVSAFLVDGDFHWSQTRFIGSKSSGERGVSLLPVIDKCGVIVKLQQIRLENPSFPTTRLSMRLPSLGFHFSPARYHRLMQIAKIFQDLDTTEADTNHPWNQADFEGWLSFLSRKGVGNREAIWQKRYVCLVGPFVYMLESPSSKSYKQYISLRGKQIYQVPADMVGGVENVFAISDVSRSNSKVVEDISAFILRCETDESRKIWQSRLQGAIYRASGSVPINNLAEESSDSDDSEAKHVNVHGAIDASEIEKVFITGVLDEFKICFNYNHQSDQKSMNMLLEDEKHLFEFRAVGGQVELLIKGKDMFIGTVLKSLEIDDLVSCSGAPHPCYLARSFIGSENAPSFSNDPGIQSQDSNELSQNEGDEFYEAEENLVESVDYPSGISSLKPPSFNRVTNLLPDGSGRKEGVELSDALDSFVKAQIVICDQSSPLYNTMDTQVIVTLATLSFFCRRPTILAIMEFVNALNTDDGKRESFSDNSSLTILKEELTREDIDGQRSAGVEEPVFKSLLGKGKSRIIFNLRLHMARAQIALMNDNETKLATLSQDNLLTDIKVYPSSFSIKASLGNLRISDDSLSENHIYFWACDMRNPGGSSFVELIFSSYNMDDEDYKGYEYSLLGQLSEVRIVYLNRFVQEIVSYFMGLIPNDSKGVVKLKDQVTNSEKWFTTGEIEGSPAVKLDVSLRKPIIVMPQRTDSLNYLKLDIVHITIQNTFQWFGSKTEMNAVHVDVLTVMVEDINLNVGTGSELGQSIIEDVKGVSVVVQRSLRDLLHQIPSIEVAVNVEQLKAALSNREYQIITDCALSNIAETPHVVPPLDHVFSANSVDAIEPASPQNYPGESETQNEEAWIDMKVSVNVNLVKLGLHSGNERDASLAILQIRQAWLLYKSNSLKDSFLSATLKSLTVIDDREGTEEEFRLAVGNSENWIATDDYQNMEITKEKEKMPIPTLLILDAKFTKLLTSVSICIQRPQLLVALDFLLAFVEFFVPSIGGTLPNHEDGSSVHVIDAIILDKESYTQPSAEIALSPQKPLVADDDRFDRFIYDGGGGTLYLQDRQGSDLTSPSAEAIIFVGTGKRLEFRNVVIKNGHFLDSCVLLGTDSSYSASKDDNVLLDEDHKGRFKKSREIASNVRSSSAAVDWTTELIVELQAIGPELTFYNTSREIGESAMLSNKLLNAQLDAFCRNLSTLAFWRVGNSMGTFLPADVTLSLAAKAYELRHIVFGYSEATANVSEISEVKNQQSVSIETLHPDGSASACTGRYFEAVASFQLIWWNEGSSTRKKLSIWRPVVPQGMVYFGDIAVQGYEPPNTCSVLRDTGDDEILKAPIDFQLVGQIKKQKRMESLSFWNPQAPPGFVSLGCIACKGTPKQYDLSRLRCIRSDMVTGVHFDEESVWDTSDAKSVTGPFSLWTVGNALGSFIVRSGLKKPPKRFALKIVDPNMSSDTDDTVIDAEIGTFSVAVFDDYGGLMVPLFNVSLSSIGFSLHGRPDTLNSAVSFSLSARSYNDKYEAWEPLVEPMDGLLRYTYNLNAPDAASQLRITATRDLNLNISVSNANMIIQAYASWNNLSHDHNPYREREAFSPIHSGRSIIDIHHKKNYYIIPQNRLGQDIFIRATEIRGLRSIVKMPSGDMKPVKVPVSKDMLDSHLRGNLRQSLRTLVTVIIKDAQFLRVEGLASHQYTVAVRLKRETSVYGEPLQNQQSAQTCGSTSDISDAELISVNWNEVFFFKVDTVEHYVLEMIMTDIGKGAPVGFFSAPLRQVARKIEESLASDCFKELAWIELCSAESKITSEDRLKDQIAKIRCGVILSPHNEVEEGRQSLAGETKSGFLQISPSKEGPWTTVRLNYAAAAACWRLGNNVVASEVIVNDGNRYVNIRSLVSIRNTTIFTIDVCLKPKSPGKVVDARASRSEEEADRYITDEYFETESYNPDVDSWSGSLVQSKEGDDTEDAKCQLVSAQVELPTGWEWVDDWHLDASSVSTPEGWVYAPNVENLKWPESSNPLKSVNYARQRRWIRNRKLFPSVLNQWISVGILKPGETLPLPLSGLAHSGLHVLELRPSNSDHPDEYSWSSVVDKPGQPKNSGDTMQYSEICVSSLTETDELLFCSKTSGTSSNCSRGLWFSINIQAIEIAKDIHSDPIQDWCIVVKSPLSVTNFLPFTAEFAMLEEQTGGHFIECSRGTFAAGEAGKVYSADMRKRLYLSLLPQRGWLPIHEAVLISDPNRAPSKSVSLRSSVSGRIVQILIELNSNKERPASEKIIRVYAPYWLSVARCPPLTYRLIEMSGKKQRRKISLPFQSKNNTGTVFEEITDEEVYEGYTIASELNFKLLGLAVAVTDSGSEQFTDIRDLSPLNDMDGSLDINAYDADGHRMRLFISSKPCPYQSVPTKVISVRPYMTFTNRAGENIFVKMSAEDDPKILHASDSRVSFLYRQTSGSDKLQVKLGDTKWSFPIEIVKEDTIYLVLRKDDGKRRFLRTEIRGYEEGSRFIVVFRLGSMKGPIRFENRTIGKTISIRQSGFCDDAWIKLEPLSTTNFSWEDPYGQKLIDVKVCSRGSVSTGCLDLEKDLFSSLEGSYGLKFHAVDVDDIKVARFTDDNMTSGASSHDKTMTLAGNWGNSRVPTKIQSNITPLEIIIELGVFGVSLVDHRPKELSYLYLERVFMSYSTGYDGGTTSRFKLILGHLQLDNQLPLTLMPVLLAPERNTDGLQPVFKITLTMRNENADDIQVYPYVYIRVTERCWRLNIHEPVIWALVNFYNNLQLDRIPQSSNVTQVDPEIRVDLIDVSEVRLKVALETAPAQRPHGVLGVWSPILSAIGNAFKIQVHLRKVMHRDRFMRKSSVLPAIGNRIFRDLIHNPLHLIFSVDVLGMTSSTLASLSKGFAELSTDGQFVQLRTKQVRSRKITGVGDGFIQGTEALAQGVAFGVSGVVRKPVESARQNGLLGLAHGLGQAFLGFIVQPLSGALDFFSLTVDGIGASCTRCLDSFNNKTTFERIRNPRAIRASGVLIEYCEREALGQMVLYLAEASRHFGCTEIFKEPSKFAWSDFYEDHFVVPYRRIVLVTSRRVMLLQCMAPEKMDKRPCKIMWDVPWEELMALELAKAGSQRPSHLILHLKTFRRSEIFVRVIKCGAEEESDGREPQAVKICCVVRRMWKAYQADMKSFILKVPSSQRQVYFAWSIADGRDSRSQNKSIIRTTDFSSFSSSSDLTRFVKHSINFSKIWSSEQESRGQCTLCRKQVQVQSDVICSIWRPICPEGYVSIGDIAHMGSHPPNVAAVYRYSDKLFAPPVGYDLVWRNCSDDYASAVSIWLPRAPDGYISCGCVAVADFHEPEPDLVYCLVESLAQETVFEDQKIWSTPDSYPWGCHLYQVKSDALHFVSLRQPKEESDWKPMRVMDDTELQSQEQASGSG